LWAVSVIKDRRGAASLVCPKTILLEPFTEAIHGLKSKSNLYCHVYL
jgi:hypothetical protein